MAKYRVAVIGCGGRCPAHVEAYAFIDRAEVVACCDLVEEKAKVPLVSGAPAHDYYAIKNVLLRDPTVTLACYLQSAAPEFPQDGNISLKQLPQTEKELFAFDVLILHDPSPDDLPPDWPALLKRFVADHGGGLAFVAGNKHTLSLLRTTTGENDLTGILPVVLDLDRADMPGIGIGYGGYFSSPWRMVPEPAALTHPATRFSSGLRHSMGAELSKWRQLVQVWRSAPQDPQAAAVSSAPGGTACLPQVAQRNTSAVGLPNPRPRGPSRRGLGPAGPRLGFCSPPSSM